MRFHMRAKIVNFMPNFSTLLSNYRAFVKLEQTSLRQNMFDQFLGHPIFVLQAKTPIKAMRALVLCIFKVLSSLKMVRNRFLFILLVMSFASITI